MTDKQIIIDGVDVSGCKYFFDDTSYKRSKTSCSITLKDCKYLDDNCYFKQLARKTQECEELREYHNKCCGEFENEKKELLEKYNQLSRDFYSGKYCNVEKCKQLYQLKAKNEQLKKQIESDKGLITNAGKQNYQLVQEYNQLKAQNETYKKMLDNPEVRVALTDIRSGERDLWQKYKPRMEQTEQKLEKIRGIAKDFHYAIIPFHRGINHEMADRIDYYLNQILQIIDEVE